MGSPAASGALVVLLAAGCSVDRGAAEPGLGDGAAGEAPPIEIAVERPVSPDGTGGLAAAAGGAAGGVPAAGSAAGEEPAISIVLSVADAAAMFDRLADRAPLVSGLRDTAWGTREFALADPDGHVVVLSQPL